MSIENKSLKKQLFMNTLMEYRKKTTAARNTLTALNNEHTVLKAVITDDNAKHKLEIQQANQQKENIDESKLRSSKMRALALNKSKIMKSSYKKRWSSQ